MRLHYRTQDSYTQRAGFFSRKHVAVEAKRMARKEGVRFRSFRRSGKVSLLLAGFLTLAFLGALAGGGWTTLAWFLALLTLLVTGVALAYLMAARAIEAREHERLFPPTGRVAWHQPATSPERWRGPGEGRHVIDTESETRRLTRPSPRPRGGDSR